MDSDLNSNLNKGALQQYKIDLKLPFLIRRGNFNRGRSYQRDGHWNQKERLKYSVFLMYFRQVLQDPIKKRKVRVYQMMSDVLLTRNAHQCRSHHQKMENYRKTIDNIIQSVAEKYEPNVFQELVQKYSIFIKMILDNKDKYQRGKDRKQSQSKQISSSQQKGENVQGAYQIRREKIDERKEKIEQRKEEQESLIQLQEAIQDEQDLQIDLKGNKEQNRPTDETYRDAADQKQQEDIPAMGFSDLKEEDLARGYFFQEPQQQQQVVYNLQVEPQPSIQPPQSFNSQPQGSLNSVHQPVLVSHTQAQSDAYGGYSNYALDLQSKYYEQQIGALEIKKKWHKYNCEQLQKQIATERQNIKYCQQTIDLYRKTLLFFQAHTEG